MPFHWGFCVIQKEVLLIIVRRYTRASNFSSPPISSSWHIFSNWIDLPVGCSLLFSHSIASLLGLLSIEVSLSYLNYRIAKATMSQPMAVPKKHQRKVPDRQLQRLLSSVKRCKYNPGNGECLCGWEQKAPTTTLLASFTAYCRTSRTLAIRIYPRPQRKYYRWFSSSFRNSIWLDRDCFCHGPAREVDFSAQRFSWTRRHNCCNHSRE